MNDGFALLPFDLGQSVRAESVAVDC